MTKRKIRSSKIRPKAKVKRTKQSRRKIKKTKIKRIKRIKRTKIKCHPQS